MVLLVKLYGYLSQIIFHRIFSFFTIYIFFFLNIYMFMEFAWDVIYL